jgi:hypothetical protein
MFCQRCKVNEVENIKYLCLECICHFPGCYLQKNDYSSFCSDHVCGICNCDYASGTEFYLTNEKGHFKNAKINDYSFYIKHNLCHAEVERCEYSLHTEKCESMQHVVSRHYSGCSTLNRCTFIYCHTAIYDIELKRCKSHITNCYACKKSFPSTTSGTYLCEKCLPHAARFGICVECKCAYKKSFVIGRSCLYHNYYSDAIKKYKYNQSFYKIVLKNNILYTDIQYDSYLTIVLQYLYLFSPLKKTLPRDVLNIILAYININPYIPLIPFLKNTNNTQVQIAGNRMAMKK